MIIETLLDTSALDPHFRRAALKMTADAQGTKLEPAARKSIMEAIKSLPPHPDVKPTLEALRDRGIRVAALTNSTEKLASAELKRAGLAKSFEAIL